MLVKFKSAKEVPGLVVVLNCHKDLLLKIFSLSTLTYKNKAVCSHTKEL